MSAADMLPSPVGIFAPRAVGVLVFLAVIHLSDGQAEEPVRPDFALDTRRFSTLAESWCLRLSPFLKHGPAVLDPPRVYRSNALTQPVVCVDYGASISLEFADAGRLVIFSCRSARSYEKSAPPTLTQEAAVREATRILDSIRDALALKMRLTTATARYSYYLPVEEAAWHVRWPRAHRGFRYQNDGISLDLHETRGLEFLRISEESDECPTDITFPCQDALSRASTVAASAVQQMPARFSSHKLADAVLKDVLIVNPNYIFSPVSGAPPDDRKRARLAYVIQVPFEDPDEYPFTVWVDTITGEILGGMVKA